MRRKSDYTWFWNTGQNVAFHVFLLCFLLLCTRHSNAYPDFIDTMSRQFFGLPDDSSQRQQHQQQYQQNPDPFSQMFGAHSQPVPSRPPPPPNHPHVQRRPNQPPQRQGYYAPQPVAYHQPHPPHHPHHPQTVAYHPQQHHPPQPHPSYDGPPAVPGHQQGFGQVKTEGNETKTVGLPRDGRKHPYPPPAQHRQHPVATEYHVKHPHQAVEYVHPPEAAVEYHHPQQAAVEYHHPPQAAVEYQPIPKHAVEYHHVPEQPVVEHHGTAIEIHSNPDHHPHHEHVEYHHAPEVEYHHYPTHKPKRFHFSFKETPDYKIVDKHLKLPPVKFRFHINPKITITSNTKDPLDKKHHDDEHDLEPYPPPDAFSDHNAPPSYSEHTIEHFTPKHHYPVVHHEATHYPVEHHAVEHHAVQHYPVEHHEARHYPVEHHVAAHPQPEYTYDLSRGHSHINPHRSSGHYEPTFKIKTRPIIFTEPPPTRPPTTTTRRTTTTTPRTTTTTTTTTARPRSRTRARLNARNPGFSVAFTQAPTTLTTSIARNGEVSDSTTPTSTTRRSISGTSSEREREDGIISARRDDQTTSTSTTTTTQPSTTTTTTTTTTTPKPTTTSTTTTTPKPTTTSTTTTTPRPTTTTTTERPTSTTTTTTAAPPTSRFTPAEETTPRTTPTLNVDANEIDMRKDSELPRRRPEPIREESSSSSESFSFENSESVKVIETTMLIDGKNQTVKFYYITQPVKLPLDVFQRVTGQKKSSSGMSVIKIRDKRSATDLNAQQPIY